MAFCQKYFCPVTIVAIIIVIFATSLQIRAALEWQSGMEFMFMVYAPFVLSAYLFLFVRGIIFLNRAIRNRILRKKYRITMAILGLIFITPGTFTICAASISFMVQYNAERISSNKYVLQLVQDCKIDGIYRDYRSLNTTNPDDLRTRVFLKDSAKSAAEKDSYFYNYRSFSPDYYDELVKVATKVQSTCGKIKFYDELRTKLPITYSWINKDAVIEALASCQIDTIYTMDDPNDNELLQASNTKSTEKSIFMITYPIPEGFTGKLYIHNADDGTRSTILDFAKAKKASCEYEKPNIDNKEHIDIHKITF